MSLERARHLLNGLHEQEFSGGVELDAVATLQENVGRDLPADYVEYLTKLGCGFASSEDFLGLGGAPHLDVVRVHERLREPSKHSRLPVHFVPLKPDGYGNYDCIDLDRSSKEKSTIVQWLHDGGDDQEGEVLATEFWDWFCGELESIRDFDAEGS